MAGTTRVELDLAIDPNPTADQNASEIVVRIPRESGDVADEAAYEVVDGQIQE